MRLWVHHLFVFKSSGTYSVICGKVDKDSVIGERQSSCEMHVEDHAKG